MSGFTLIELLVVIGIVMLAAILVFVAAESSRKSSEAAICVGNLRQIMVGIAAYAGEHNGSLPPYSSCHEIDENGVRRKVREHRWVNDLTNPAYTPKRAFFCPTAKGKRAVDSAIYWAEISYGINIALSFDYPDTTPDQPPARMTQISAETILVTDASTAPDFDTTGKHGAYYTYPWPTSGGQSYPRHRGSCHVLWGDGRVTAVRAPNPRIPSTIYDPEALGRTYTSSKHWLRLK